MPVKINSTGGGSVTLEAASTASAYTLTLPASSGTPALTASPTFTGNVTLPGTGIWNSSGNVGIGTSSPGEKLQIDGGALRITGALAGSQASCVGIDYSGATRIISYGANTSTQGSFAFLTSNSNATTTNQAVTIDTSGNFLVATNTYNYSYTGSAVQIGQSTNPVVCSKNTTANTNQIIFNNPNGQVGFINTSGSGTSYSTTSDYRLKDDVQPMVGGLSIVSSLKPVTYKWKSDNSFGEGFIAHELGEIIPLAVFGEKDEVLEDGNIKPQGVDYSRIVVHLVSAVQELKAELDAAKAEIAALKGNV